MTTNRAASPRRTIPMRAATLAMLALVVHASPARAVVNEPTWTVSPTTVRNGDRITASGTGCVDPDTGAGTGLKAVVSLPRLSYPNIDDYSATLYLLGDVEADGSWTATGVVDTREGFFGPYADFDLTGTAGCLTESFDIVFPYPQSYAFSYDGHAEDPTTTVATTTPTTATSTSAPATPAPPVAAAVTGSPSFTG